MGCAGRGRGSRRPVSTHADGAPGRRTSGWDRRSSAGMWGGLGWTPRPYHGGCARPEPRQGPRAPTDSATPRLDGARTGAWGGVGGRVGRDQAEGAASRRPSAPTPLAPPTRSRRTALGAPGGGATPALGPRGAKRRAGGDFHRNSTGLFGSGTGSPLWADEARSAEEAGAISKGLHRVCSGPLRGPSGGCLGAEKETPRASGASRGPGREPGYLARSAERFRLGAL